MLEILKNDKKIVLLSTKIYAQNFYFRLKLLKIIFLI